MLSFIILLFFFFFFNDPATTEIYTLSLHDALPICLSGLRSDGQPASGRHTPSRSTRSEEHTSELQSRFDLVCRLLLEKKKKILRRAYAGMNSLEDTVQRRHVSKALTAFPLQTAPLYTNKYILLTRNSLFFFFNDTPTTEIYTLSLHDALPISRALSQAERAEILGVLHAERFVDQAPARSEEHTSELQSRFDLVCRLLLEKKKTATRPIIMNRKEKNK